MNLKSLLFVVTFFASLQMTLSQNEKIWNGKKCAVVLTYDDALNVHLDNVIPCLDSVRFKGTFYVIGNSPVLSKRLEDWRSAAFDGHELGNHTLNHPCDGSLEGRSFVTSENDLSKYTVARAVDEIRVTNTLLNAIDGKTERTFAFPCGDTKIDGVNYYDDLETEFAGARGVKNGMKQLRNVQLEDVNCYMINNQPSQDMIELVDKAIQSQTLLVFLFHGVGGEHNINVTKEAHSQLVHYLKLHENEIWVAPMVDVAKYITSKKLEEQ